MTPVNLVAPGTRLTVGPWFECIPEGATRIAKLNPHGQLYLSCRCGTHLLDGQLSDDQTHYVGLKLKRTQTP